MRVGSLFTGIGGLDLGLERAGMTVAWQSEIDPYCCKVLAKHWPNIPNLGDIKLIDWKEVEPVDLICGGYPCQPFSLAGVRRGENDPRHLWPWMRDAIRMVRPRWVLLENVPGHLGLGFDAVLGDLAASGYDCEWDCIPAAAVGAPHLRYRVFVVGHTNESGLEGQRPTGPVADADPADDVAHARGARRREDTRVPSGDEGTYAGWATEDDHVVDGDGESGRAGDVADAISVAGATGVTHMVRTGSDRQSGFRSDTSLGGGGGHWAVEPDVGRVAHGVPHRVDRLRALGNAVVPQVAEWIGRRIMACDPHRQERRLA